MQLDRSDTTQARLWGILKVFSQSVNIRCCTFKIERSFTVDLALLNICSCIYTVGEFLIDALLLQTFSTDATVTGTSVNWIILLQNTLLVPSVLMKQTCVMSFQKLLSCVPGRQKLTSDCLPVCLPHGLLWNAAG